MLKKPLVKAFAAVTSAMLLFGATGSLTQVNAQSDRVVKFAMVSEIDSLDPK